MCSDCTFIVKFASPLDTEISLTGFYFPGSLLEPFLWIGIALTSTSVSGTVAACKDGLPTLAKTVSPSTSFKTGWWGPSGRSDLSPPGLFDPVRPPCRAQCAGLGTRTSLEGNSFSASPISFSVQGRWLSGSAGALNGFLPVIERKQPLTLLALRCLASRSCLVFSLCLICSALWAFLSSPSGLALYLIKGTFTSFHAALWPHSRFPSLCSPLEIWSTWEHLLWGNNR